MGAGASVGASSEEPASGAHSSRIDEARQYFGNEILMRGFWAPIDQDGGGSVTLTGIRNYLRNTNPENVVAIYAGPFLGPFATSSFCLKQAYWTCTGRTGEDDPDTMELQDHEFKLMLKHLFFYHSLYSSFGESCVYNAAISLDQFSEALEDLLDDSLSKESTQTNYTKLGESPTFGDYVRRMTESHLSDEITASHASALMIEDKLRAGFGVGRRSFSKDGAEGGGIQGRARAHSIGGSEHMGNLVHETVSCVQYKCRDVQAWIQQIQELGVVPFKSLIDDILVTRVAIAQDLTDKERCVMMLWHVDSGQGYQDFEEANMEEGGVFMQAAEEGVVELPFTHVFFNLISHDGWNAKIRPGDALNLSHFSTKSHIGFTDSLQEDIDSMARSSGALQNFVGKLTGGNESGGAILSHFTASAWEGGGQAGAASFQAEPPVKYMVSGPVTNVSCKVLATYETFTWLVNA